MEDLSKQIHSVFLGGAISHSRASLRLPIHTKIARNMANYSNNGDPCEGRKLAQSYWNKKIVRLNLKKKEVKKHPFFENSIEVSQKIHVE